MLAPYLPTRSRLPSHLRYDADAGRPLDAKAFGAIGDGTLHLVTEEDLVAHTEWYDGEVCRYTTSDTWDFVGIQEALYSAYGVPGQKHGLVYAALNREVYVPAGDYRLNRTLFLVNCIGVILRGAGRFTTKLSITAPDLPVLETNCAYSVIQGIYFASQAGTGSAAPTALVEWTWDGGPEQAGGMAHLSVYDCLFHGNGFANTIGFRAARDLYQGDNLVFHNCFFAACAYAGFMSAPGAYNALSLGFNHCNFQACPTSGILIYGGNADIWGCSFQLGSGFATQTGFDITLVGSANSHSVITNCRTENVQFLHADSHQNVTVAACFAICPVTAWAPNTATAVGDLVKALANLDGKLYRALAVTGAGETGGVEPVWDGSSAGIMDGDVEWGVWDAFSARFDAGSLDNCTLPWGRLNPGAGQAPVAVRNCLFSREDWLYRSPSTDTALGSSDPFPIALQGNRVILEGGLNQGSPIAYAVESLVPGVHPVAKSHHLLAPNEPLLFPSYDPLTGTGARDVGFWRPPGTQPGQPHDLSRNVNGILGALGPRHAEGANAAGADLLLQGGLSTGTGAGGAVKIRAAPPGAAGSDLNDVTDRITVTHNRLNISSLPTSNPGVAGDVWNDGGVLKVSSG